MPEVSGLELLESIKGFKREMPVLLMTAYADLNAAMDSVKRGAFDFIIKPLEPDYLVHAVEQAVKHNKYFKFKETYKYLLEDMVAVKTNELQYARNDAESLSLEMIKRLTSIAEFRDTEGGEHVNRIGMLAELLAQEMGMPPVFVRNIKEASPLHDIGKIGITDYVLFKLGPLTPEEMKYMKTHTTQGAIILSGSSHPVIQLAQSIALTHHERWNGTGYPKGLKGDQIPIEGRIANICDQYDAIRSERVYKPEYSHEDTVRILTKGDGRTLPEHFDPDVLNAFINISSEFDVIYQTSEENSEDLP